MIRADLEVLVHESDERIVNLLSLLEQHGYYVGATIVHGSHCTIRHQGNCEARPA